MGLRGYGWSILSKSDTPSFGHDLADEGALHAMWSTRCQIVHLRSVEEWSRWRLQCDRMSWSRVLFLVSDENTWHAMLGAEQMVWHYGKFRADRKAGQPHGWLCMCEGYAEALRGAWDHTSGVVHALECHMGLWEPERKSALHDAWRAYPIAAANPSPRGARKRTVVATPSQTESVPEGISFHFEEPRPDVTPEIKQAVRRLHLNTGHASAHDLARMIRMAGGCKAAVDCAKHLRCSTCLRHTRPGRQCPAHIPDESRQFNDRVQLDLFCVTDVSGINHWFMLVCDTYTGFVSGCLVHDHSSQTLWKAYRECWLQWAGPPLRLVGDQERGLQSEEFLKQVSLSGSRMDASAPYASWQKAKVERCIESIKDIVKKSVSHCQA
eukprot:6478554-Amphidinium_carterae.1